MVKMKKRPFVNILLATFFLYSFLVSIKLLEKGIKTLGSEYTDELFQSVSSPFAGLLVGTLATVLVQSSSVTTATIVGLVGSGFLNLEYAIPMVMGANIGTTVTNTLVSFGHVRREQEFKRAFAASTMHDFFNLIAVLALFPLQLATGFLTKMSITATDLIISTGFTATKPNSPIKAAIKWGANLITDFMSNISFIDNLKDNSYRIYAALLIFLAIVFIFLSLKNIVSNMKVVMLNRIEFGLDKALAKGGGMVAILVGILITFSVQSSSITTSILVPIVGSGILAIENAFPITLGANIGTTITAVLASFAVDTPEGLTIALCHVFFNLLSVILIYPIKPLREVPIKLAKLLSTATAKRKYVAILYVLITFVLLPLIGIVLFN
ncbi:MAG: Na/Pi symporter [Actinomycetota bacterium]|nr:Na/Pi symporter [Actinomycetota bacterium]